MPDTTVHPSDTAERIAELRDAVQQLADRLDTDDTTLVDLEAERWTRLAEYALTRAHESATTRQELSDPMFGFQFTALAVLEPDGVDRYDQCPDLPDFTFAALTAISDVGKRKAGR